MSGTAVANAKDYVLNTAPWYIPSCWYSNCYTLESEAVAKEKFSLTAVNSAGSGANVQALGAGTADFAILQGLFGSGRNGNRAGLGPQKNLRSVTMLCECRVPVVATKKRNSVDFKPKGKALVWGTELRTIGSVGFAFWPGARYG